MRAMEPAPRSREEFLVSAARWNRDFCERQAAAGRPVMIEYVRGMGVPTGQIEQITLPDGDTAHIPVFGRGEPIAVIVGYRGDDDLIRIGTAKRTTDVESGLILYRRGRRAGKVEAFSRPVEPKPFSKVEGVYRALRRAAVYYENRVPTPISLLNYVVPFVDRFVEEERKRAEKIQLSDVAS